MSDAVTLDGLRAWVSEFARLIEENRSYLTDLDSAIGDADHGTNMARGMAAAAPIASDSPPRARPRSAPQRTCSRRSA